MANQALQSTDERERALLASYAMFSNLSEGRRYEEDEHPYRSFFQRDRDRIVYSAAYRRLSGKMQVFTGDIYCQGPVMLQTLSILNNYDLKSLKHNSTEYIHLLTEAMKLAFSDREKFYGDPNHISNKLRCSPNSSQVHYPRCPL